MKFRNLNINQLYVETVTLFVVYFVSYLLSYSFSWLAGLIMIVSGTVFYFYLALNQEVNFLKLSAVFTASWMVTIGLANFRLLKYQVAWEAETWVYIFLGHAFFYVFNTIISSRYSKIEDYVIRINPLKIRLESQSFSIRSLSIATIVLFLIGMVSFAINVIIKGYIPALIISTQPDAYYDFYTRWQIFIVASLLAGALAYYVSMQKETPYWLKRFMLAITFIQVFVLPLLLVQRGTFLSAALVLTAVVYLYGNRKFYVLLSCIAIIFGTYVAGSYLRGYSSEQLIGFFQPKDVFIKPNPNPDSDDLDLGDFADNLVFRLSPTQAFLYSYLTVSHDNFNSSVEKHNTYMYGVLQFAPFNVILRNNYVADSIEEFDEKLTSYQVLPHLNTFNLISDAFFDFGWLGIMVFSAFWGSALGLLERFCSKYKGIFSTMAIGVTLTPIALSFMNPWMSNFAVWLMWGTLVLMFILIQMSTNINRSNQQEKHGI